MKKSFISVIIVLLSLSLIGAIVMQALWVNNEWKSRRETFDRDVKDALNRVAERLETQEAASFLSQSIPTWRAGKSFAANRFDA